MKNFKSYVKKGQLFLGALALAGTLSGCAEPAVSNDGIYNYDYEEDGMELDRDKVDDRIYDVGERNVTIRSEANIDLNKPFSIEAPEGYRILNTGYNYYSNSQYFLVTFENIVPVKVRGYYDHENNKYVYIGFGKPIEQEKDNNKITNEQPTSKNIEKDDGIKNNGYYKINYVSLDDVKKDNIDESRTLKKTYESETHYVCVRSIANIGMNNPFSVDAPNGYENVSRDYKYEASTSDSDNSRQYIFATFVNVVPVEVTGILKKSPEEYLFINFGEPVSLEKTEEANPSLSLKKSINNFKTSENI